MNVYSQNKKNILKAHLWISVAYVAYVTFSTSIKIEIFHKVTWKLDLQISFS